MSNNEIFEFFQFRKILGNTGIRKRQTKLLVCHEPVGVLSRILTVGPIDTEAMQCGKEIPEEQFQKQGKQQGQRDWDRNKWREGQSRPPKKNKSQNRGQGYKQQRPIEDEYRPVDYEDDRPQKSKGRDRQVPDSDL